MSKRVQYQWIRCSREIRSLTNELSEMRRELRILRWSVARVIILLSLLCLWMIRMRPSPRKMDSTSRAPTNGTRVVRKIATAARMICLYVLVVVATSCSDRALYVIVVADARPMDPPQQSRQCGTACSKSMSGESCGLGTAWWTQLSEIVEARHVTCDRIELSVSDRTKWRAKLEQSRTPTTVALVMRNEKSRFHLA